MDQYKDIINVDKSHLGQIKIFSVLALVPEGHSLSSGVQHCFQVSIMGESFHNLVAPTRALQTEVPEKPMETLLRGPAPTPWAPSSPPREDMTTFSLLLSTVFF